MSQSAYGKCHGVFEEPRKLFYRAVNDMIGTDELVTLDLTQDDELPGASPSDLNRGALDVASKSDDDVTESDQPPSAPLVANGGAPADSDHQSRESGQSRELPAYLACNLLLVVERPPTLSPAAAAAEHPDISESHGDANSNSAAGPIFYCASHYPLRPPPSTRCNRHKSPSDANPRQLPLVA